MKYLFLFLLVFTSGAAVATEPGSQYQQQAEAGDRRAQYYLADTWVSSGDYEKAEYWRPFKQFSAAFTGTYVRYSYQKFGNQRRRYIFWAYGLPNRILSAY